MSLKQEKLATDLAAFWAGYPKRKKLNQKQLDKLNAAASEYAAASIKYENAVKRVKSKAKNK